jgi:hypothetical protein
METTSLPVQPPSAIRTSSFGLGAALLPPKVSGPSMVIQYFESDFAENVIPRSCLTMACFTFSKIALLKK